MAEAINRERSAEEQAQYDKLVNTPIPQLILRLSIPTVLSMMITMIYNLADSYFVGRIGTSASASIGIVLSVQAAFQAVGFMFGHGSGTMVSRLLGAGNKEEADRTASTGFVAAILSGLLLSALGLLFLTPLMRALGSTETILPYAVAYGRCIFLSGTFFVASCVLNNILRYEGQAVYAMIGLVSGSILNIILDPVFIFGFDLGVLGAGISTAVSQSVSFFILLFMFHSRKAVTRLSLDLVDFHGLTRVRSICHNGFPSLIRQLLNTVATAALNICAGPYGDAAIAAMTIVGRIGLFMGSFIIGIGQGYQPVAAYNNGAGRPDRIRSGFRFTLLVSEAIVAVFAIAAAPFAGSVVGFFRDDPDVIRIGTTALYFVIVALFFEPFPFIASMMFQSIGEARIASFLASLRSGLYYIPLLLILPQFMGLLGIQSASFFSDILNFLTSIPFAVIYFRSIASNDPPADPVPEPNPEDTL